MQIRPFLQSPCVFLYLHSSTIFCRLPPESRNVPSNTHSAGMIRMGFCLVTGFLMFKTDEIPHRGKRRIALWIMYFLAWSFSFSYFCFPDDFNEHLCNISTDFNGTDVTRFWKISWNVSSCFVFTLLLLNFSKVFLYDSFLMSDNKNSKSGKHELKVFNMEIVF